jgi:hypothetical protein
MLLVEGGSITITDDFGFDGFASKYMVIRGSTGATSKVHWLDATRFAERAAKYHDKTGRPLYFYDIDKGETKAIQLLPVADDDYTAFAVIYITAPGFPNGLANLPAEFRGLLVDMVSARLMDKRGREDGDAARRIRDVEHQLEDIAHRFDDKGASRSTALGHGHMKLFRGLGSYDGSRVLSQK